MVKLLKYDFYNAKFLLFAIVITTVLGAFICPFLGIVEEAIYFVFLPIASVIMFLVYIASDLNIILNNKIGYLTILTPNSGYKISLSKILFSGLFMIIIILAMKIFFYLNLCIYNYLQTGSFEMLDLSIINELLKSLNVYYSFMNYASITSIIADITNAMLGLISIISIICFSMVLSRSLFTNMRGSKLIAFIIFLALYFLFTYFDGKITEFIEIYDYGYNAPPSAIPIVIGYKGITDNSSLNLLMLTGPIYFVITGFFTFLSGLLLEKKINL